MLGKQTLLVALGALCLDGIGVLLASIEVAPDWLGSRDTLCLGLAALSLVAGVLAWGVEVRQRGVTSQRLLAGGVLLLLLLTGGWLVLLLRSANDFGLMSRTLVQSIDLSEARGHLYIYEYEGVPDGFEESVVMLRTGRIPWMHPLLRTRSHVGNVVQKGEFIYLSLEGASANPALQCNLTSKLCQ